MQHMSVLRTGARRCTYAGKYMEAGLTCACTQANASCAALTPLRAAISSTLATSARFCSACCIVATDLMHSIDKGPSYDTDKHSVIYQQSSQPRATRTGTTMHKFERERRSTC